MAPSVLREIKNKYCKSAFYAVVTEECVDVSNCEQLVLCFWWADETIQVHEDFVGLYYVPEMPSKTLVTAIN